MKKRVTVVVARYLEDIGWLRTFDDDLFHVICYNKGTPIPEEQLPENVTEVVSLPNVGREAHTYLYHITNSIGRHNSFDTDYVVFFQGNPFDHLKRNMSINDVKEAIVEHVNANKKDALYFSHILIESMGCYPELHMREYMKHFGLQDNYPEFRRFVPGAQFMIHKDAILKPPMTLYQEMFEYSKHDRYNNHPPLQPYQVSNLTAYTIERLWGYIFGFV